MGTLDSDRAALERLGFRNLLADSEERIYLKDLESRFVMVSSGWLRDCAGGRPLESIVGRTDFDVFSEEHAAEALADERRIIETGRPMIARIERETYPDRADAWVSTTKRPLRDADGRIVGTYGISHDVTEQVLAQRALAHQARHDPVTGLVNRPALMERLTGALGELRRTPGTVTVLFLDLDGFRAINDGLGHAAGDALLAAVGTALRLAARRDDVVARVGGDEFVVLCRSPGSGPAVGPLAERIRDGLRGSLPAAERMQVAASIGVARTVDPEFDPAELVARADAAMREAKRSGRDRCAVYDDSRPDASPPDDESVHQLRRALDDGELQVLYQPIVSLGDETVVAVEALVRWRHRTRGVLEPGDFLDLIERGGIGAELDAHVLDVACAQLAAWERVDPAWRERTASVNVSGQALRDPRLLGVVLEALHRHGLAPGRLCLEITETVMVSDLDAVRHVVGALSEHGVRVALDDFGTGFSTLAHLQQLPADVVKIDRSFVSRLGRDARDGEIVAAVTAMARALGMRVIAEGVETERQRAALRAIGCDAAQGFHFAEPMDGEGVARLAARGPSPAAVAAR